MQFSSLGDLAQNLITRRQSASLSSEMNRVSQELTTGLKADLGDALGGDFSVLASVQRSLSIQDAFAETRTMLTPRLEAMQNALNSVREPSTEFGLQVLSNLNSENEVDLAFSLSTTEAQMDRVVGLMNTTVAGRSLFSGTATDQPSLASTETILDELRTATAGAIDGADFVTIVDDWFSAPGGGFETLAYAGADAPAVGVSISTSVSLTQNVTAQDDAIRAVLKNWSMLTLAGEGSTPGGVDDRDLVIQSGANGLINSASSVIGLQGRLGAQQEKVERASVESAAEQFGLEQTYNALTTADTFEAASRLEEVQTQLEMLYIITARTSQLNLATYLR